MRITKERGEEVRISSAWSLELEVELLSCSIFQRAEKSSAG
jgi:hypothetical protein